MVLSDNEINALAKDLDFEPVQRKINKPELRYDFGEFCRRMRTKWNFCSEKSAFHTKSSWNPPKGNPHLPRFFM